MKEKSFQIMNKRKPNKRKKKLLNQRKSYERKMNFRKY